MLFKEYRLRSFWLLTTIVCTLGISGCSDSDSKVLLNKDQIGTGAMFHGAEWATIKDLDPRGEECVQCHGKEANLSPNGGAGHNIGLANTKSLRVEGLEITGVTWNGYNGTGTPADNLNNQVTVTFKATGNYNGGAVQLNLARLAPNISQTQGANATNETQLYDWSNYLIAESAGCNGQGGACGTEVPVPAMVLEKAISNALQTVTPTSKGNGFYEASFNLNRNFGLHTFEVTNRIHDDTNWQWGDAGTPADTRGKTYTYTDVLGVKVAITDVAKHVQCLGTTDDEAKLKLSTADTFLQTAGQVVAKDEGDADAYQLCWWPDGTRFPAGYFVTDDNHVVIQFNPDLRHRVGMVVSGTQGSNAWFDFVPNTSKSLSDVARRDIVTGASCNSCHGESKVNLDGTAQPGSLGLSMHGGNRAEPQLCVTCHNPGNFDATSARTADFKQMIHKIHRGSNLPSVRLSKTDNADGLVVRYRGNQRHNTRFPQGRIPGQADGISNCVKCHMGEDSRSALLAFAQSQGGAKTLNEAETLLQKLQVAAVTPQGDNWRTSRSIEACQSCHDDVVWQTYEAPSNQASPLGNTLSIDSLFRRYMPSLTQADESQWRRIHRSYAPPTIAANGTVTFTPLNSNGTQGRANFSCGGCHFSDYNATTNVINTGTGLMLAGQNTGGNNNLRQINNVHNKLLRNAIMADRFVFEILSSGITGVGDEQALTATYRIYDRQKEQAVNNGDTVDDVLVKTTTNDLSSSPVTIVASTFFGWMEGDSPDYTHSAGTAQPGSPTTAVAIGAATDNGDGTYTVTKKFSDLHINGMTAATFANMMTNGTRGTVVIEGHLTLTANSTFHEENPGRIRIKSANQDFRFDGAPLAAEQGRREVIDFEQTCMACHMQLSMHNGARTNNTQLCVVCHTPNMTDVNNAARRGALSTLDGQFEESEDYKRLIHAVHAAGKSGKAGFRIDPIQHRANLRPDLSAPRATGFPNTLSNCQACHIQNEDSGKWTFELDQLPKGQIGSSAITHDWATVPEDDRGTTNYDPEGKRHNLDNHMKMSPITSVCSSCHDAGYKTSEGRVNNNILDGGPYVGSHWWVMGGIAPGIVRQGEAPNSTKHQSGL